LRCAERPAGAFAFALLLAAARGEDAAPSLHEATIEGGLHVVVAPHDGGSLAVAFSLPVGFANEGEGDERGRAAFAAGYATFDLPAWHVDVGPDATLFTASLPSDGVEAGLAELVKRLVAAGVEDERLNHFVEQRKLDAPALADRLREAAYPQTREGQERATPERMTREKLQSFLNERVGSEGAVVALVGPGTPAALELSVTQACGGLPRAKGVAPREPRESMPLKSRRVVAPAGASGGLVGLRLAWHADEEGDLAALAAAWFRSTCGGDLAQCVDSVQGTLLACAPAADRFDATAQALNGAIGRLATDPLSASAFDALVERIAEEAKECAADPARLARTLAQDSARHADPLAAFGRAARLRAGADRIRRELSGWLVPAGRIDVTPLPARPAGS